MKTPTEPETYQTSSAPGSLPLVGHVLSLARNPLAFLENQRQYGDIVDFRIGRRRAHIVNHPDLVQALLTGPTGRFDRGDIFAKARPLFGNGLAVADGKHHRDRRRTVQPLLNSAVVTTYLKTMADLAAAQAESWHDGQSIDLNAEMANLTVNVVAATIFGVHDLPVGFGSVLHRNLPIVVAGLGSRAYGPVASILDRIPSRERTNYRRALSAIHEMVDTLISANPDSPVMARLSANADRRQLHDDVTSLLIGGSHNSAMAAAWQFMLIGHHPHIRDRLQEEVDRVLGDRPATPEDLPELVYTHQTVLETLRLYPPIWLFPRRAAIDLQLGGHRIEQGSQVFYSPYAIHRDPRWYPDPGSFDPGRWDPSCQHRPRRGAYIPFAAGVHACPGDDFAIGELSLLTATVMTKWQLAPTLNSLPEPVAAATLGPRTATVTARARRKSPQK